MKSRARDTLCLVPSGLVYLLLLAPGEISEMTRVPSGHQTGPSPRGASDVTTSYRMGASCTCGRRVGQTIGCRSLGADQLGTDQVLVNGRVGVGTPVTPPGGAVMYLHR